MFYCRNRGHEPKLLAASFVDDGICGESHIISHVACHCLTWPECSQIGDQPASKQATVHGWHVCLTLSQQLGDPDCYGGAVDMSGCKHTRAEARSTPYIRLTLTDRTADTVIVQHTCVPAFLGLTDCCDGTDELSGCKNTCSEKNSDLIHLPHLTHTHSQHTPDKTVLPPFLPPPSVAFPQTAVMVQMS